MLKEICQRKKDVRWVHSFCDIKLKLGIKAKQKPIKLLQAGEEECNGAEWKEALVMDLRWQHTLEEAGNQTLTTFNGFLNQCHFYKTMLAASWGEGIEMDSFTFPSTLISAWRSAGFIREKRRKWKKNGKEKLGRENTDYTNQIRFFLSTNYTSQFRSFLSLSAKMQIRWQLSHA